MKTTKILTIIFVALGLTVLPTTVFGLGPNPLLWNRLGSDAEVTNSETGPDGTIVGDISYFPCMFDNGFKPDIRTGDPDIPDNYVKFDGPNLGQKGCIEFWFLPDWVGGGHCRDILQYGTPGQRLLLGFGYNDWQHKLNLGLFNSEDINDSNYVSRYIVPSSTPEWSTTEPFHIAIVWDGTAADNADKLKLYLNGNERGTLVETGSPTFADWDTDNYLYLASRMNEGDWYRHNWEGSDGIMDNIKIWDSVKTDFSDRFVEGVPMGFTYQGRLIDADSAADGLYDFQFKLFNSTVDGNQVGDDANKPDVDVIDGYFTVKLYFGSDAFNGDSRWLEIGVRPGDLEDPNAYTTLSPRQEVTPTPYSIHAKTAETTGGEGMPPGVIVMWSGEIANIPAGWALCDGTNGTPDLRDRFILGVAAAEEPGATGGNHSYTLSTSQLPSHRHWVDMPVTGSHSHTYTKAYVDLDLNGLIGGTGVENVTTGTTSSAGAHDHDCYTNYYGGGQAFDNRPAYYKLAFIMKL